LMQSLKRRLISPSSQCKQEKVLMFSVNDL
jgi:hypothetical protein